MIVPSMGCLLPITDGKILDEEAEAEADTERGASGPDNDDDPEEDESDIYDSCESYC